MSSTGVVVFAQEQQEQPDSVLLEGQVQQIPKNEFKKDRYIYLWDVTLSMQGKEWNSQTKKYDYVKEKDIYDLVVDEIIRDINSITDESTEIVVIPFQSAADGSYRGDKNPWICKTASGPNKQELIEKIRSSKKNWLQYQHINTDVVPALKYVIESVISEDRIDYLKILTDGGMADMDGLRKLMAQWCQLAGRVNGMHAFYISLNKEASESIHQIIRNAQDQDCFKIIDPGNTKPLDFFQVLPYQTIAVNCNDQLAAETPSVTIQLQEKSQRKLPGSFVVSFEEDPNDFLTVNNCKVTVKDNSFTLPLQFKMTLDQMKRVFHNGMKFPVKVHLTVENGDNIYLLEDTVTLYLTVEKEKRMTLSWE